MIRRRIGIVHFMTYSSVLEYCLVFMQTSTNGDIARSPLVLTRKGLCRRTSPKFSHLIPLWRYTTHSGCVFYSPLSGFSLLAYEVTWSHTATRHSRQYSSERMISPSQRPLPDNTQHSQQTNIHGPILETRLSRPNPKYISQVWDSVYQ
jgi:hypothetical protein